MGGRRDGWEVPGANEPLQLGTAPRRRVVESDGAWPILSMIVVSWVDNCTARCDLHPFSLPHRLWHEPCFIFSRDQTASRSHGRQFVHSLEGGRLLLEDRGCFVRKQSPQGMDIDTEERSDGAVERRRIRHMQSSKASSANISPVP